MTKPRAYYNEIDEYAAQWLRNLIEARLIADGDVDGRDIRDVTPAELASYTQCHFFAGIGVWSYALRLAGWPDDLPVWTGSCPCQPFSAAGKRGGLDDERHLWPAWDWLIGQCAPQSIFGEQVASSDGLGWLDLVCSDLEGKNYAVGSPDSCAAGVGAPHIRQRLRFVAYAAGARSIWPVAASEGNSRDEARLFVPGEIDTTGSLAHAEGERLHGRSDNGDGGRRKRASRQGCEIGELEHSTRDGRHEWRPEPSERSIVGGRGDDELASVGVAQGDAERTRLERHAGHGCDRREPGRLDAQQDGSVGTAGSTLRPGPANGFWRDADWIACTDGKWRPVESGSFPLVDGSAFRLGSGSAFEGRSRAKMLKGYGNAVVAPDMAAFIAAAMEWRP